jgi:hypothetical protein
MAIAALKCPFAEEMMFAHTELQTAKSGMPVIILSVPIKHFTRNTAITVAGPMSRRL